jgi:adenosylhomocysteine nucleosidase
MIGIIAAMDEEIAYLVNRMQNKTEKTIANSQFFEGELEGKPVVLLKSGIGKVNAAMGTTIMMERYSPSLIINTGSAGGFSPHLNVGDLVIADRVVHHDVDVTSFEYDYGQVPGLPPAFTASKEVLDQTIQAVKELGMNYEVGLIATGDSFMEDESKVDFVREKFPEMIAAEMEAAAIAQVSHQYDTPFVMIRALSDVAGKDSSITFDAFLKTAAKHASELIRRLLQSIDVQ